MLRYLTELEAEVVVEYLGNSTCFIAKQIVKILASSSEELDFPYPYDDIRMMPTTYKNKFIIQVKNDTSNEGAEKMKKLIDRLMEVHRQETDNQ